MVRRIGIVLWILICVVFWPIGLLFLLYCIAASAYRSRKKAIERGEIEDRDREPLFQYQFQLIQPENRLSLIERFFNKEERI